MTTQHRADLTELLATHLATHSDITEAAFLLMDLRGYLQSAEAQTFVENIVKRPYSADRNVQEATVRWIVRADESVEVSGITRAIRAGLTQIAQRDTDKLTPLLDSAVVEMMLALAFWILSGTEEADATAAFWMGLKTLFKLQSSHTINPLVEAFEILEPLLIRVNPDLLSSAIMAGSSDSDPLTRALFVILRSFGGPAKPQFP